MATQKKKRTFTISAQVNVWTDYTVEAESFEEAMSVARSLTQSDFVKPLGPVNDWALRLVSVTDDAALTM